MFFLFCIAPVGAQDYPAVSVHTTPQRIVSLNMCIDQLLWELVPHERLTSLSYLSANPMWSPIANQVKGLTLNHGLAEEIVPLNPDLILAGEFDAREAINLLQHLGHRVERLPVPQTLEQINQQVLQLGDLVGAAKPAQHMNAKITAQLEELQTLKNLSAPLTAFWYSSNGVVIGAGTLEHELMLFSGLRNLAAERGIQGFIQLDLELLLSAKPEILIVEESNSDAFSLAREYLSHPALASAKVKVVRLPAGLSGCAASVVGDIAYALKQALTESQP